MNRIKSTMSTENYTDHASFGECLKLPYYCGTVEHWMVAINIILIIINVITVVLTIGANTVFLLTYFKTRSLRTPHYFFLMLLALTDISVGLVSQPLFLARKFMEIYSVHDCVLWVSMRATVYYFSGISFLTLTLVSIERFYAVSEPIKHRNEVTHDRMGIVASIVWFVWLTFPIMRFCFSEYYKFFGMLVGGIIITLFVINALIYLKIRRCVSERQTTLTNVPQIRRSVNIKKLNQEARLARTVACLMLVMVLAYLPTALGLVYKAMTGVNTIYMFVFLPVADTLVLINSTFNPFFYCYRNKNIRDEIKKLYKRKKIQIKASTTSLEHV